MLLPEIRKIVIINASIEKVWKAVATSEGLKAWWMENTFKHILGQEFVLKTGSYGDSPCKITEFEPQTRIGFDWDKDWHIVFELKKLSETKTQLTLVHSGWDENKTTSFGQPHTMIRTIMDNGWSNLIKEVLPKYAEK